jgi:hypothetical protein
MAVVFPFGAILLILFVFYATFMVVAQFILGKALIVISCIALGYYAFKMASELEKKTKVHLIGAAISSCIFGFSFFGAALSETACDDFYIGKVFGSGYGPIQSGATITHKNYSKVCSEFVGFAYACRQYEECKAGSSALKPGALFLFGLFCTSLGALIGVFEVLRTQFKPGRSPKLR